MPQYNRSSALRSRGTLRALALLALVLVPACQKGPASTPEGAARVVRDYYDALNEKRYQEAYNLWESNGRASGKSFVAFLNSYAQTTNYRVTTGAPSPIEGAAGSRFITVPVQVTVRKSDGTDETMSGAYTLRLSVVDGATPEQRRWHLYTTTLARPTRPDSLS
jgi:hypothetical protein